MSHCTTYSLLYFDQCEHVTANFYFYYFSHPLTFNLFVSLYLKCFVLQTIYSWVLLFCPLYSNYLLIGLFRPFMFKVIIDILGVISVISVPAFQLSLLFFDPLFVFHSFSFMILFGLLYHSIFSLFLAHPFIIKKIFLRGYSEIHILLLHRKCEHPIITK